MLCQPNYPYDVYVHAHTSVLPSAFIRAASCCNRKLIKVTRASDYLECSALNGHLYLRLKRTSWRERRKRCMSQRVGRSAVKHYIPGTMWSLCSESQQQVLRYGQTSAYHYSATDRGGAHQAPPYLKHLQAFISCWGGRHTVFSGITSAKFHMLL